MCGRYSLFAPREDVEERFGATFAASYRPRYNAAPRQSLPLITGESSDTIDQFQWGLIPSWAEDRSDFEFINARAETVREKRSFAEAFERRPCLVPADGFYEWTQTDGAKQPYRITRDDESLFAMAGLYERWEPPQRQMGLGEFGADEDGGDGGQGDEDGQDDVVETFTILTSAANEAIAHLHDRMPIILDPDDEGTWLGGGSEERASLLSSSADDLAARPVARTVNDPSNDSPAVLRSPEA